MQETRIQSLGGKIPWRRKWQPTPVFLSGKSSGQRSMVGYSPRGCKESDTAEQEYANKHFKHSTCTVLLGRGMLADRRAEAALHIHLFLEHLSRSLLL